MNETIMPAGRRPVEYPTLGLIAACYLVLGAATHWADSLGLWLAVPLAALAITLHSSLQHEVLHGHPLPSQTLSVALVFPAVGLFVPYERFRDLHLAHHHDAILTDPYDDPESNYLNPEDWVRLPGWHKALLRFNNTLLGRMLVGPAIGLHGFWKADLGAMLRDDGPVIRAYALHAAGLAPVMAWLILAGTMPVWAYLIAAYAGFSVLKIRTFLEHRAHERTSGRSVIVEDRGPLALLFLNNNYHALHHADPRLAWYDLPGQYRARREQVLARNGGYRYTSYFAVFRAHFVRAKDPVPHPIFRVPARDFGDEPPASAPN